MAYKNTTLVVDKYYRDKPYVSNTLINKSSDCGWTVADLHKEYPDAIKFSDGVIVYTYYPATDEKALLAYPERHEWDIITVEFCW